MNDTDADLFRTALPRPLYAVGDAVRCAGGYGDDVRMVITSRRLIVDNGDLSHLPQWVADTARLRPYWRYEAKNPNDYHLHEGAERFYSPAKEPTL